MDAPEPNEILTWMFGGWGGSWKEVGTKQSCCQYFWNMHETMRDGKMVLTLQLFCPFPQQIHPFNHTQYSWLKVPTYCSRKHLNNLATSKLRLFLLFQQNSNQCNSESNFHYYWASSLYISVIYKWQNHYPRESSKSKLWHCLICIQAKLKTFL